MLDNIMLGRYIKGNSFVHQLDPRAKLLGILLFFVVVFQANALLDYSILILFICLCIYLSDIALSFFVKGLKPMVWLILFTAVFQVLLITTGDVYVKFWIITISSDGLLHAFFVTLRILIIISMSTLLTLTTNPLMLSDAIENMLKLFGNWMPAHEIALIFSIALRFVPTILDEAKMIMNAQRARGVDFEEGNLFQRMRHLIPILVPLFAGAIRRSEDLADAMEARGYQGGEGRTKYRQLAWRRQDTLVFVVLGGLFIVLSLI